MKNIVEKCLLCGAAARIRYDQFPGYQEPDTYSIYHCASCNTSFSLPRVKADGIYDIIYKNADKVPGYDRYWEYSRKIKKMQNPLDYLSKAEVTYWAINKSLNCYLDNKKNAKILEIGSGLGYLTYSLIRSDFNVRGLDISQNAVDRAKENFGDYYICDNLNDFARKNPGEFDIIILTEVIEHINEPLIFITSIMELLKPGGKAIITTPNKSLYPKETVWISDIPPVHCWWFSEESMKYIADQLNASIHFIDFNEYYKKNINLISIKSTTVLPKPFFDSSGNLILRQMTKYEKLKSYIKMNLNKIPNFEIMYLRIKKILKDDIIICSDRGTVLCATLIKR